MISIVAPRPIDVGPGIRLSVHEQGSGPAVVLCHGFPELAFSWRYQLPALAESGFRAIAPDMRGYGASSAPREVEAYGLGSLCADLVGLLDACELERAVFVGHDWGGFVAWAMAVLHPERCAGIVGLCTPYVPFPDFRAILPLVEGDARRYYVAWFQRADEPERHLDANVRSVFAMMRGATDPGQAFASARRADGKLDLNPFLSASSSASDRRSAEPTASGGLSRVPLLTRAEMDYFVQAFERSGFFGPVSWYRNIDANRHQFPEIGERILELPCLQISAEWDPALPPRMAESMRRTCTDLELHVVPRAGHWLQQEYPVQVNGLLLDWLERRFG